MVLCLPRTHVQVDQSLLASSCTVTEGPLLQKRAPFMKDFAARRMERDMKIMQMSQSELTLAWEACIRDLMAASVTLEDEIAKGSTANVSPLRHWLHTGFEMTDRPTFHLPALLTFILKTDHIKRTFDYEPFLTQFITRLHNEGILNPLLDLDENGRRKKRIAVTATGSGKKGSD